MTMHGGDVWQAAEQLGIDPKEILDFSANVNPRGMPAGARNRLARDASDPRLLSFYPDPSARRLRQALSEHLNVPVDSIVIGPGAEALFSPILRYLRPSRALVPVPAFSEYRRACEQNRIAFTAFPLERSELFRLPVDRFCSCLETDQIVFLNSPHNPTGAVLLTDQIEQILSAVKSAGATLLLDEAFIDYLPGASLVRTAAQRAGLIVIRSLTKFYGCPALRVGYAVAHPETIRGIAALEPAWPVMQLAMDALADAIGDREYADASVRENTLERQRFANELGRLGFVVFPSAANYLFLELSQTMPGAADLRTILLNKHRILIRACDSYEGLSKGRYVRLAVRSGEDNRRVVEAFAQELMPINCLRN